MPNLVHSLDAATLSLLIDIFFKKIITNNFYSVHDCFAVTCNKVSYLTDILKAVYVDLYSKEPYLKKLDNSILNHIKINYGDNCFNPNNNIITIEKNGKEIQLKYPNINNVILNNTIELQKSSYLIH